MIASHINLTTPGIDAALTDAKLPVCAGCNVTPPIISGVCESCE